MPVNTPHADYAFRKPDWQKIRAFAEGSRVVKAAGETFLPKPKGWKDEEYNAYKQRAEVYGATDRTVDGLCGAIFRKSPVVQLAKPPTLADNATPEQRAAVDKWTPPEEIQALERDVTLTGKTLTEWLRDAVTEVLQPSRYGVLIDFTGASVETPANASAVPAASGTDRPYIVPYTAEQIINWDTETVNGVTRLTLVVLEETASVPSSDDAFLQVRQTRYRVLRLVNGVYTVEIWTPAVKQPVQSGAVGVESAKQEVIYEKTDTFVPGRRGVPLAEIPFVFFGPSGRSIAPEKPVLLDMVDLCQLHYMTSADYAHGLHWVGLPTPVIIGATDKEAGSLAVGPSAAIILSDPNAKALMLEFTGAGLGAVEGRMASLEKKMAALGARILEERETQAESGEAIRMRQSGDASVLAGISDAVSRCAEAVLAKALWWAGIDQPDVSIALNMEFFGQKMDPQTLVALMQARQAGEISRDTFLWNLQKGEMLPEGTTIEAERAKIETDTPAGMGVVAVTQAAA